ncbi:MAG TPA: DoxX family protein [Fimbriimonadaceae bacterium]|nr:DoxX family protein [Fimbriimonadaceae bacterium]
MNVESLSFSDRYKSWTPYLLSILRIAVGFLFVQHGIQKIFGELESPGQPPVMSQFWIGGILELIGGGLLILGLLTRPIAFILSGMMAVAYFQVHAPGSFWPIVNKGELAALYSFVFLFFSAAGAGPISLDALFSKEKREASPNLTGVRSIPSAR